MTAVGEVTRPGEGAPETRVADRPIDVWDVESFGPELTACLTEHADPMAGLAPLHGATMRAGLLRLRCGRGLSVALRLFLGESASDGIVPNV